MKRILTLITISFVLLCAFCISANAEIVAEGACGDNVTYTLDDAGTLTISGTGDMYDNHNWNFPKSNVNKVIINDGVGGIGMSAFKDFINATEIIIPDSVSFIEDSAFSRCSSLESILLPEDVMRWGSHIFSGCSSLKKIDIPYGASYISPYDFEGCTSLEYISLPQSVLEIHFLPSGDDVFSDFSPFNSCPNIKEIKVDEIYPYYTSNYTSIDGVLYERSDNDTYTLIKYPPKKDGTEFTVPKNVQYMTSDAFSECKNLMNIYVEEGNNSYSSTDGVLFSSKWLIQYPIGRSLDSYTVPDEIMFINYKAFAGETDLKDIGLPDDLLLLSDSAFYGCTNLNEITLPDNLDWISNSVFYNCSSLNKITFPIKLAAIGQNAFYNTALYNNSSNWIDGVLFIDDCLIKADGTSLPEKYTIPNNTRIIASSAFNSCKNLKTISLPVGLERLEDFTFYGCSSLKSLSMPKTLTYISNFVFSDSSNLTYIYYEGTEEEWDNIYIIKYGNESLLNATIIFEASAIFDIPDGFGISNYKNTIDGTSFDLTISGSSPEGDIYVALYSENGDFLNVTPYDAATEINITVDNADGKYIKVMWWDKSLLTPLSSPAVITLW